MENNNYHGTANGYGYKHCRCVECTAAWRDYRYQRGYVEKRRNLLRATNRCYKCGAILEDSRFKTCQACRNHEKAYRLHRRSSSEVEQ